MRTDTPTCSGYRSLAGVMLLALTMPAAVAPQEQPTVIVEAVAAGSTASKVGLAVGDRLVSYGSRALSSPAALQAAEENTFEQEVSLTIRRGDRASTLVVPPGRLGVEVRPDLPATVLTQYAEGADALVARRTDDVITHWTSAASAAQKTGDAAVAAWLYGRVGELRQGQRRWKEAAAVHLSAWELLRQGGDQATRSRTLAALGRCWLNANDLQAARRWYEQAEQLDLAAGYEAWAATTLANLGYLAFFRSDYDASADYHHRALSIRERLAPDSLAVAGSLNDLGGVARVRSDLEGAERYYARGLAIRERLAPNSLVTATSLNNMGLLARERGDLAAAYDYESRGLAIGEALAPGSREVAVILNNLGLVAQDRGDLMAAHDYHVRTLAISERLAPDSLAVAGSLTNLGSVASARGDWTAAHDYASRSLTIKERLAPDSQDLAVSLSILGNVSRARGDLLSAATYHGRALEIRERSMPNSLRVAESLNQMGNLARDQQAFSAAGAYHRRALELRDRLAPASMALAQTLTSLGDIALSERRFADALPLFTRAVAIVESHRWQVPVAEARALFLARHAELYSGLWRAHLALGDLPAAFATAERARARSLLEILTEANADIREGVDQVLLNRERQIQQQLNRKAIQQLRQLDLQRTDEQAALAKTQMEALLVQYQEVQAQIRARSPRYAALTQPRPLGLREVQQQLLDENSLLLEYALGETSSVVFVVSSTSIRAFDLPGRAEIEQAARRVTERLMARQALPGESPTMREARVAKADAEYPDAAAALSRMVLGPLSENLIEPTTADRRRRGAAVCAVWRDPSGQRTAADCQPRDRQPAIRVGDCGSTTRVERARNHEPAGGGGRRPGLRSRGSAPGAARGSRQPGRATVSLPNELQRAVREGSLLNDRGTLARLPFTRDEADAILALSPPHRSMKAIDFEASRATVVGSDLGRHRIVHLATHGVLNTEHPELSGLVLSLVDEQGRSQDGFLRLHEIYNLNWSADLVVLSACQTALGKQIRGEGLVGLTRGFMYAGARSVVASLWNVNDSATAEFMKQFYRGMLVDNLSPAAALRASQVAMLKRTHYRSPFYWAAFVLQGDWRQSSTSP